jgi:hypothetical protein
MNSSLATRIDIDVDLVVARAHGDFLVHLAEQGRTRSLCGQVLRSRPPHKSFRDAGCRTCLASARDAGEFAAREGARAFISLLRI